MSQNLIVPRIGNAAGTCKTERHFELLLQSAADVINYGPITLHDRPYNPGDNQYVDSSGNSINSHGLPNDGLKTIKRKLPELVARTKAAGKIFSVTLPPIETDTDSGREDVEIVAEACIEAGVDIIEICCSCGNVWKGVNQKRILCFQLSPFERMVDTILAITSGTIIRQTRFKLSPYSDPGLLAEIADIFGHRPRASIVTTNTFANAFMFREENGLPGIEFGRHLGGYGGSGMKPIGLGQVRQFRDHLPNHHIIGVGGIKNGQDMFDYTKVGANEVQIGSAWYFTEDPRIFGDTLSQFIDIREQHSQ